MMSSRAESLSPRHHAFSRRGFLQGTLAATGLSFTGTCWTAESDAKGLKHEVGVTTGSFMRHLSPEVQPGKLRLLDLPEIMHDRLNMRVIDLMTRTLASFEPSYLDELRSRADKAGCVLTNMKMNQKDIDMASPDRAAREKALAEYKRTIDASYRLGCRWVRPLPGSKPSVTRHYVDSYRHLIDYAAPKGITLLIENYGWMKDDPDAIPRILDAVGDGLHVSPDTGNWSDAARYKGLEKAFPRAVTCDFKAYMLGPKYEHPRYDLKRCFQIGWNSGFRGPWCLEHFNTTLDGTLDGMAWLRDRIHEWTRAANA